MYLLRRLRRLPSATKAFVFLLISASLYWRLQSSPNNTYNAPVLVPEQRSVSNIPTAVSNSLTISGSNNAIVSASHASSDTAVRASVDALFKGMNLTYWKTVYENQLKRQLQLAEACQKLGLGVETPNFKTSDMYVNDSLKYIFCVVNKVACTSWKRALLMASGQMTVDRPEKLTMTYVHNWRNTDKYMPRIRNYNLDEVKQRIATHFKFMFVRHPLERLVSTYRDKFTKPAYYYKVRFGTKIIRAIRGANASSQALKKGIGVTFREMVLYLLDPGPNRRHVDKLLSDNHWRKQNDLCHPCYVRYDFVGHYETLFEDALFVLARLGVSNKVKFPGSDPDNKWKKKTAEVAANILNEIHPDELDRVRELYREDFQLFAYNDHTNSGKEQVA